MARVVWVDGQVEGEGRQAAASRVGCLEGPLHGAKHHGLCLSQPPAAAQVHFQPALTQQESQFLQNISSDRPPGYI